MLVSIVFHLKHIIILEQLIKTQRNENETLTDNDLRRMMQDPKYWRDNDPEYVRKIENGFKKLYS